MGSCRALDWPAKHTTSGFVSGTAFWAAFLMPAAARSPVYGPRCGPSFGATETPHFGNHNVGPNHLDHLLGCFVLPILVTRFGSRVRVHGFRVALRTPKLDPCTFRALYHEAGLGVRNLGLQTGPKTSTKSCLTVNVACAQLPLND